MDNDQWQFELIRPKTFETFLSPNSFASIARLAETGIDLEFLNHRSFQDDFK